MIFLASSSPRRKKLLKEAGVIFRSICPDYDEKQSVGATRRVAPTPSVFVKKHAFAKAASCVSRVKEGVILGSDTVVYFSGRVIGKPKNHADAFKILTLLQGRWHVVYTGVALLKISNRRIINKKVFVEKTKVRLRAMDRMAIEIYFKKINPLDKAGAYAIQSDKANIIADVKGSLANATGLPVERLTAWTGSASKDPLSLLWFRGKWQGRRRREKKPCDRVQEAFPTRGCAKPM